MKKVKVSISFFRGLCLGISFPFTTYADIVVCIGFLVITFNRKK